MTYVLPQNPYIEQQLPWGQSPHMALLAVAPHDPSVVMGAVASLPGAVATEVGLPRTGSPEVVTSG